MKTLLLSAAAVTLFAAAPALAQIAAGADVGAGAAVSSPLLPSGAGPIAGQTGASAGIGARDPVAAATDITSPTSRRAQAAALDAQKRADDAAAAATNSSATIGASGSVGPTSSTPAPAPAGVGNPLTNGASVPGPTTVYPSMGGGVVTPTP